MNLINRIRNIWSCCRETPIPYDPYANIDISDTTQLNPCYRGNSNVVYWKSIESPTASPYDDNEVSSVHVVLENDGVEEHLEEQSVAVGSTVTTRARFTYGLER